MSEGKTLDEWLLRYLIVGVFAASAILALLWGLSLGGSTPAAALGAVVLLIVTVVVARDLGGYRSA
jgi:putative flippase GtrA